MHKFPAHYFESHVDGAGQAFYSDYETDYINEHAERLGISEDEAVELYESTAHLENFCALAAAEPADLDEEALA